MDFKIPDDLRRGDSADMMPLAGEVNWGMDVFGVGALRDAGYTGTGIIVCIVDTGADLEHPLLINCIDAKDFTGSSRGAKDVHGHGTHCTGTVGGFDPRIGVAHGAKTIHGKGLGDSGSGNSDDLVRAMEWGASRGATIFSCSWGGGTDSRTLSALKSFANDGLWPIFAAGNSGGGTQETDQPGRSMDAINVAALNKDLTPATFTSAGNKLDTSGPGVGIWSAKSGGGFVQMSGTSMATPFVAGLLACYRGALMDLKRPVPLVHQLREMLFSRSTDTHTPGDDRRTGPGWVTPMLLSLSLTPLPPPVN